MTESRRSSSHRAMLRRRYAAAAESLRIESRMTKRRSRVSFTRRGRRITSARTLSVRYTESRSAFSRIVVATVIESRSFASRFCGMTGTRNSRDCSFRCVLTSYNETRYPPCVFLGSMIAATPRLENSEKLYGCPAAGVIPMSVMSSSISGATRSL